LLRREGYQVNQKRVHRLWKEEGLQLPRRPRKRRRGPKGEVVPKAEYINHVWSYDFLEDRTQQGGQLRLLTVLDEFTRECLEIRVERSITAAQVIDTLDWLALVRGLPAYIRSDNGPEFIAKAVQQWLEGNHCRTIYIEPGSPWEIPYIESFNGKLREECLNSTCSPIPVKPRRLLVAGGKSTTSIGPTVP
jgi:putative transposase